MTYGVRRTVINRIIRSSQNSSGVVTREGFKSESGKKEDTASISGQDYGGMPSSDSGAVDYGCTFTKADLISGSGVSARRKQKLRSRGQ